MSSAHKYRGPITAAIGVESSRDHWPPSPLQYGTELIECDASSADSEGEVSGLEDNIASRLAGWLALRLKCQPGDISVELSELLRSTQKGLSKDLAPRNIGSLGPTMPTASGEVVLPGKTRLLPGPSNKLIGTSGSLSFQSIRALGHRRGFSFLPGDDSANPISSNSFGGRDPGSEISLIRPLAWQDTKQKERGGSGESAKGELSGGWAVGLRSQQELIKSDVPSTARSDVSKNLQRDGSGKSILTTIISSSSRSSSLSHRGSLNNVAGTDGLREGSIRSGNSHLAIAAARAAKIGTVNGRAFQRQSSS